MFVNELHHGGIRALLAYDNTIFDNLYLPNDLDDDDNRQMIIDRIIFKYGDTPLFSPDPAVMKYYIGIWSYQRSPLWERFYKAATQQYDPLENYDRNEKFDTDFKPGAAYESLISADDSSSYQPDRKTQPSGSGKDNTHVEGRIHGNIGVTTSQQMLKQEIDIIPELDVIDFIATDWHQEFNLGIY